MALHAFWVLGLLIKTVINILINNSRTAKPTNIFMTFLSFSENILEDDHII